MATSITEKTARRCHMIRATSHRTVMSKSVTVPIDIRMTSSFTSKSLLFHQHRTTPIPLRINSLMSPVKVLKTHRIRMWTTTPILTNAWWEIVFQPRRTFRYMSGSGLLFSLLTINMMMSSTIKTARCRFLPLRSSFAAT